MDFRTGKVARVVVKGFLNIYPQNILGIFYGPIRLIYTLDLLSILPITLVGTLLVRNSSSLL